MVRGEVTTDTVSAAAAGDGLLPAEGISFLQGEFVVQTSLGGARVFPPGGLSGGGGHRSERVPAAAAGGGAGDGAAPAPALAAAAGIAAEGDLAASAAPAAAEGSTAIAPLPATALIAGSEGATVLAFSRELLESVGGLGLTSLGAPAAASAEAEAAPAAALDRPPRFVAVDASTHRQDVSRAAALDRMLSHGEHAPDLDAAGARAMPPNTPF